MTVEEALAELRAANAERRSTLDARAADLAQVEAVWLGPLTATQKRVKEAEEAHQAAVAAATPEPPPFRDGRCFA